MKVELLNITVYLNKEGNVTIAKDNVTGRFIKRSIAQKEYDLFKSIKVGTVQNIQLEKFNKVNYGLVVVALLIILVRSFGAVYDVIIDVVVSGGVALLLSLFVSYFVSKILFQYSKVDSTASYLVNKFGGS